MAALASSAVSLYPTNGTAVFYPAGKGSRDIVTKRLKLVLTGQGGLTNTIGAAALGFETLIDCSLLWDETNSELYPALVHPGLNTIIITDTIPDPIDVTTTVAYITVTGTPLLAA